MSCRRHYGRTIDAGRAREYLKLKLMGKTAPKAFISVPLPREEQLNPRPLNKYIPAPPMDTRTSEI